MHATSLFFCLNDVFNIFWTPIEDWEYFTKCIILESICVFQRFCVISIHQAYIQKGVSEHYVISEF